MEDCPSSDTKNTLKKASPFLKKPAAVMEDHSGRYMKKSSACLTVLLEKRRFPPFYIKWSGG
jgi:hypothetical protein